MVELISNDDYPEHVHDYVTEYQLHATEPAMAYWEVYQK